MKKLVLMFLLVPVLASAQTVTLEEAAQLILARHPSIQSAELEIRKQSALKGATFDLPKTDVTLLYGQYNSAYKNDNNITVVQRFPFPVLFAAQHRLTKSRIAAAGFEKNVASMELLFQVRSLFNDLLVTRERIRLYIQQDSLNRELVRIARLRHTTGEGPLIFVTSAEAYSAETSIELRRSIDQYRNQIKILSLLAGQDNIREVSGELNSYLPLLDTTGIANNASLILQQQKVAVANFEKKTEIARALPDLQVGYFNQTLVGTHNFDGTDQYFSSGTRFQGFQLGVSLPLVVAPQRARIRSAGYAAEMAQKEAEVLELELAREFIKAKEGYDRNHRSVFYYEATALPYAELLTKQSVRAYQAGEIDYTTYIQNMKQALAARENYLAALHARNADHISILLLTGN